METEKQLLENAIRDHLSGTSRKITKAKMFFLLQNQFFAEISKDIFDSVWKNLIEEKYLLKTKQDVYTWETISESRFVING